MLTVFSSPPCLRRYVIPEKRERKGEKTKMERRHVFGVQAVTSWTTRPLEVGALFSKRGWSMANRYELNTSTFLPIKGAVAKKMFPS